MAILITGVLLWAIVHLMPSISPSLKASLVQRLGQKGYKGLFALTILLSLILIVIGWRSAIPQYVYDPPSWGRHAQMLIMLVAVYLIAIAHNASRIKKWVRHPMLTAVVLWAAGHLLCNGDSRALILFGGIGLWALIAIFTISRREGAWVKPEKYCSAPRELLIFIISVVVYLGLIWAHPYYSGAPIVPA